MLNLVDIEKGLYGAAIKKRRHFILFLLATIVSISLVVVLIVTSTEKYALELIFTILITSAYLVYVIFYFTVISRCLNAELRFFEGATNAELSEYRIELCSISKDLKEYNGREYYVLEAKVKENLKDEEKIFYLPKSFSFKKNQEAIIHVFGSIVIDVELRKWNFLSNLKSHFLTPGIFIY